MSIPIDNQQKWMFLYHEEIDPAGVPLEVKKEQDGTVLKAYEGQVQIQLIKYDKDSKTITGRYQVSDPIYPQNLISGNILFKIDSQDTKKWIGFPKEFHGLCRWTIWSLDPQSEEKSLDLKSRIKKQFFG